MARVTVEDCVDKVENRFELVLLASHRARMISSGAPLTIDRDNDKNPVVALREIADETIAPDDLKEDLIHSCRNTSRSTSRRPRPVPLIASPPSRRRRRRRGRLRPHVGGGACSAASKAWFRRTRPKISEQSGDRRLRSSRVNTFAILYSVVYRSPAALRGLARSRRM